MDTLIIILSVIVTGGLWLKFIYRYDKIEPEPIGTILKIGIFGGLVSAACAAIINNISSAIFGFKTGMANSLVTTLFYSMAVGLNEEFMKAFAAYLFTRNEKEIDEPIDPVIYSTGVALGFAVIENFEYTFANGVFNLGLRTFTAMPLHIGLAVLWGVSIARVRFFPGASYKVEMTKTVLTAAVIHGIYDFVLFYFQNPYIGLSASLIIAIFLVRYMNKTLLFLQNQTPFLPAGTCSNCGKNNSPKDKECRQCKANLMQDFFVICEDCAIKIPSDSKECPKCGMPVNPKYLYQDKNYV